MDKGRNIRTAQEALSGFLLLKGKKKKKVSSKVFARLVIVTTFVQN